MNQNTKSSHSSSQSRAKHRKSKRKKRTSGFKKFFLALFASEKSPSRQKIRKKRASNRNSNHQESNSLNSSSTSQNQKNIPHRRRKRRRKKSVLSLPLPLKIALSLLVITVGLSTILGSAVSISNSVRAGINSQIPIIPENTAQNQQQLEKMFSVVSLGQELGNLKTKLQQVIAQYPKLQTELFIVDLTEKNYVNLQGGESIAAASTIKLPVLIAFFQDVDGGKIHLQEKLTMTENLKAGGSGGMQYQKTGTRYSALYTATQMMVTSDNSATNMIIERLGGQEKLNQRFADWGLNATTIRNPLPDLEGTNTTSAEDLGKLLIKLERGELVSLVSRDRILRIMSKVKTNTLLPKGLEKDATIAHKTGDIGSVLGDVGIIDMPNGTRYVAAVFVKRPKNDPQAKPLIQKISQTTYQHFKFSQPRSFLE
ncbi:MAG: serine hydrolase [Xenococcaceae cyanobacterium MO_188.B19]|nr:serine hydrolase [Xenococcaceae cyanobacterium MO_188.B19]